MRRGRGNGTPAYSATGGPYGNRRGYHGDQSLCDDSNFGQSKEACRPRPVTITYVYECAENPQTPSLPTCTEDTGKRPSPAQAATGCWDNTAKACIFVPRVHIKDNWGLCTGRCPGGPAGEKCFDDADGATGNNECRINKPEPWVSFHGRVIVSPP